MTEGNEVEELTDIFRTLLLQQRDLQQQLTTLNQSIAHTNERLSLLLETNQEEPNGITETSATINDSIRRRNSFEIGDRVIVTNRYRGLQGTVGKIIKLSNAQATIEADNGETFRKYKQNLRKL